MNGNGRPRVDSRIGGAERDYIEGLRRAAEGGGSPYDTTEPEETISRMYKDGESLKKGDHHIDTSHSGFLNRIVEDYFTHGSIPVRLKEVGRAIFGVPTEERTQTWGDSTDQLSFSQAAVEFTGTTTQMALHVNRTRPTTFTLLTTVDFLGVGWNLEGPATVTINYTVGIGLTHTTITKVFDIAAPAVNSQPVLDITTAPLQSLVASVSLAATNNNANTLHTVHVVMLAAPVVQ